MIEHGIQLDHLREARIGYSTFEFQLQFRRELKAGDLVFFYEPVSHVGIYVGDGKFIHAPRPGGVARAIDHQHGNSSRRCVDSGGRAWRERKKRTSASSAEAAAAALVSTTKSKPMALMMMQ